MPELQRLVHVRSRLHSDDEPVLPQCGTGPVFGDDLWDLSGGGLPARVSRSHSRVDFSSLRDDRWHLLAKEFFWARLNVDVFGATRLPPQCARSEFSVFTTFASWMLDPAMHPLGFDGRLSSLDYAQLDSYAEALRDGRTSGTVGLYLRTVERLHDYSDYLSHDRLLFHPWRHRTPTKVAGYVHVGDNRTPRIPQDVLGPFLHWALLYVAVAGNDILAGLDELSALRKVQDSLLFSGADASQRVLEWVEQLRRDGRGVPGRPPQQTGPKGPEAGANILAVSVECGLNVNVVRQRPELRALLGLAVAELASTIH